ncbi:MAG: YlbF family regulator [Ruminococcaceae bacterium]|nr:YlbF family regulator [Oscillospiraceae bacterium]
MDVLLEMAKEMGEALQQDERYVALQMAQAKADEDKALQDLIGEFNLKRMALATESEKDEPDEEKLHKLDADLHEVYSRVMANESMQAYNTARIAIDQLLNGIQRILTLSAQGEDPHSIDTEHSCGGNCGSCGGCH